MLDTVDALAAVPRYTALLEHGTKRSEGNKTDLPTQRLEGGLRLLALALGQTRINRHFKMFCLIE